MLSKFFWPRARENKKAHKKRKFPLFNPLKEKNYKKTRENINIYNYYKQVLGVRGVVRGGRHKVDGFEWKNRGRF